MKENPKETAASLRKVSRRGLLIGAGQLAMIGVLGQRMHTLGVDQADEFRLLAEENRINIRLLAPPRGIIYDRKGVTIAENNQNYQIIMVREEVRDLDKTLANLSKLIRLDEEDIARIRKDFGQQTPFVTVADRLDWDELTRVAINGPALPGVNAEVGLSRLYPLAGDFAHVVGYVGPVSERDLEVREVIDPLLRIPRFEIGKTGIEYAWEETLRGQAGTRRVEVNARGRIMRNIDRKEGLQGDNLQITVDTQLQNYAQARLEGESAAVVVMDCKSGDLLAVASTPSFDPNLFVRGISSSDYNALRENKYRPFPSKAVQGAYPPGSTFKMVTALAALHAGEVTPDETVWCPGHARISGRRFHCWKGVGHGWMDLHNSIKQSCDVYYYDMAQRVGIDAITEMARKLGLGTKHDIPMSGIVEGLTPTREWKARNRGEDWLIGDTVNASIGQGFVLASPLQLAVMAARIATGKAVAPRLIKSVNGVDEPPQIPTTLGLNENHLRQIRKAMFAVSNNRRGTGFRSRIVAEEFQMAGKTGTSQVRNITAEERRRGVTRNDQLPWERRDHALFVNYAPYDDPRVAVAVIVEHGGGGSKAAAPIARDVTLHALYDGLPPLEAYPESDREAIAERHKSMNLRDFNAPKPGRDRA